MEHTLKKWVEIDLDKVAQNVREIKKILNKDTLFIAVVKADGYGHGMEEISEIALQNGADWLCVTDCFEGERLRKAGFKAPIFVLSPPFLDTMQIVISNNLIQGIDNLEQAKVLNEEAEKHGVKAIVHIKIDSGLGRFGIAAEEIGDFVKGLKRFKNLTIQGAYTHFASPYLEIEYTKTQYRVFEKALTILKEEQPSVKILHCANSAAAMDLPKLQMKAVRVGFSLCNRHEGLINEKQWNLQDCLQFKTRIQSIRSIGTDQHIGYDNKFITKRPMQIAILPVGYADGVPTTLANKGYVLVKGERVPIIGSICMSQIFIDLTDMSNDAVINEEVVIIGTQGEGHLTYKDLGGKIGFGDAETVLRISQALPKVFYKGGKILKIKE